MHFTQQPNSIMTMDSTDHRRLMAATGYLELGMFTEAEAELDAITPDFRHFPEIMEVRMEIYSKLQQWERMQGIAERLMRKDPTDPHWAISYAYATRRALSLEAAKDVLRAAIQQYPKEPTIPYNLACYECQLGELESAKRYFEKAIELQPSFGPAALKDPDMEPLKDWICTVIA